MRSIAALLAEAAQRLEHAGIDQPRREARLLLAHAIGCTPGDLLALSTAPADPERFEHLLRRRERAEPMARITGRQGFWTLDLAVSADTLIPRPDSETLIEAALAAFPDRTAMRRVLDLGTGSGCLLLAALSEFPAAWGVGVDRSEAALRLARRNAGQNGLADRTAFLAADWGHALHGGFDLVLCNPPYIAAAEIDGLMPGVSRYEPRAALDGGPDGFCGYRRVLEVLARLLVPNGRAVIEAGVGQMAGILQLAARAGLASAAMHRDLTGIERAATLQLV